MVSSVLSLSCTVHPLEETLNIFSVNRIKVRQCPSHRHVCMPMCTQMLAVRLLSGSWSGCVGGEGWVAADFWFCKYTHTNTNEDSFILKQVIFLSYLLPCKMQPGKIIPVFKGLS